MTFHPDERFYERLQRISEAFTSIVVIDNGSGEAFKQSLQLRLLPSIAVIQNTRNLGLAKALNQGLAFAIRKQFAWVCTFDQDSLIDPALLVALTNLFHQATLKPMMIGCNYWHSSLNRPLLPPLTAKPYYERKTLISSGTLISLTLPQTIGYFREDYFIDSVDHEYSLRARQHGHRLLISSQVLMHHSIGRTETYQRVRIFRIPEHSPIRKYYITRNSLTTAFHYFQYEPMWGLKQLGRLGVELLAILIYEQQKREKIAAMRLGIWHALTGKLGELTPAQQTWQR